MKGRLARAAGLALAFSPALAAALLMRAFVVEVPVWDDLERARLLAAWKSGTLGIQNLYELHIEHRFVVARLITLANAIFFDGTLVWELWATFVIVALGAAAVHVLLRQSFPGQSRRVNVLTFLANLLLFSSLHWETYLWAVQTGYAAVMTAFLWGLVVLRSQLGLRTKFALAALCALAASHGFSHGVVVWPGVFAVVLLAQGFATPRGRVFFLAAWLALMGLVAIPYFTYDGFRNRSLHAYTEPGSRPTGLGLEDAHRRLPKILRFYGAFVGSPLARTGVVRARDAAPAVGYATAACFLALAAFFVVRRRDAELWNRALPWLAMGGLVLVAATAPSLSRTRLNTWIWALVPHYLNITVTLPVALVALVPLAASDLLRRTPASHALRRAWLVRAPAALAGGFVALQILHWGIGIAGMREWHSGRLQARTSLLFLEHFEPERLRRMSEKSHVLHHLVALQDEIGFLFPSRLPDTRLANFEQGEPLDPENGGIERARGARRIGVRGFAWLPQAGRRADGVLLSVRDAAGERQVVAVAEMRPYPVLYLTEQDHVSNGVHIPGRADFSHWRGKLETEGLPERERLDVELWAVDAERLRVHRLPQHLVLQRAGDGWQLEIQGAPGGEARG